MKRLRERINEWLFFAESDLHAAGELFNQEIYHLTCFHTQQCVEKSLKAVILRSLKTIPKVHILPELLEKASRTKPEFKRFEDDCRWLNEFYRPTRYPDVLPGSLPEGLPTKEDAKRSLEIAKEIFEFTKKVLNL